MLEKARETYPGLSFIKGNALDFSLESKADVIFSNAVFHWIDAAKQEALAENLSHNLRRGGGSAQEPPAASEWFIDYVRIRVKAVRL